MKIRIWLTVLLMQAGAIAEMIPVTHGTTLSGEEVVFPLDLRAPHSILILGFSERSAESSRNWGKKIWGDLVTEQSGLRCYQLPVLASVPRLFRGLILRAIRKETPENLRRYFVPFFENEQEWKQTVQFSDPDAAYLLVVKQSGEIEWRSHGDVTPQGFQELKRLVSR